MDHRLIHGSKASSLTQVIGCIPLSVTQYMVLIAVIHEIQCTDSVVKCACFA